jgi:ABC-type transporter Mla subunit MlaD
MSLSSSLNELIIRGHQIQMHGVQEGLYNLAQGNDHLRESLTDWILDLQNINTVLDYYVDYERRANRLVNEARLENAKQNYEMQQLKEMVEELQKKLDRCIDK